MSDAWLRELYDRADALDAAGFAASFHEDASFTFANNPPMYGPEEISFRLGEFFAALDGMRHELFGVYQAGDTQILEALVTYTRKDGSEVTLPGMTLYRRDGDRIREGRVYIDLQPLFA
ncbi:nuclear transport factor 2 family protein [Streptomyces krungchingensis]